MYNGPFPQRRGLYQQQFGPDVYEGCIFFYFMSTPDNFFFQFFCP